MSFTYFLTTSSATFSGNTSSNMSTISLIASSFWLDLYGRDIIDRESPYTANEKAELPPCVVCWATAVGGCRAGRRAKDESRTRRLIMFVLLIHALALREGIGRRRLVWRAHLAPVPRRQGRPRRQSRRGGAACCDSRRAGFGSLRDGVAGRLDPRLHGVEVEARALLHRRKLDRGLGQLFHL